MSNRPASSTRRPGAFSAARSRVADLLGRTRKAAAVGRIMLAPEPKPAPPVDRAALVNYATFLALERIRVCAELYPHLGDKAHRFVLGLNAAERFFHPDGTGLSRAPRDMPAASARAEAVLDLVGIDWRSDPPGDGIERSGGASECVDTGERPAVPYGWPAIDAALVEASADLLQLDAAIAALIAGDVRDAHEVPGYLALEEARASVLVRLADERAESLLGLQAKAHALLTSGLVADPTTSAEIGHTLARDLLDIDGRAFAPQSDPIFAAIDEGRRLLARVIDAYRLPDPPSSLDPLPAKDEAANALVQHCGARVLLTVPTTAAGCIALARFAEAYRKGMGVPISDDPNAVLSLIARSPAR